jgi:hypothetical protein
MLRFCGGVLCVCLPPPLSAECARQDLDKMNSRLSWATAYPDATSHSALPSLKTYVVPKYTDAACAARWKGAISASIVIDETGVPDSIDLKDDPGFGMGEAVKQALRTWRFEPANRDASPVRSRAITEFGFAGRVNYLCRPSSSKSHPNRPH